MSFNPFLPSTAKIIAVKAESADVATYTMALDDPLAQARYRFEPGQYNMVSLPGIGEAPISISSSPKRLDAFEHTIRFVGRVTNALAKSNVGDTVGIRGPYGRPWPLPMFKDKDVAVIVGGTGCACVKPAIVGLLDERENLRSAAVLYGAKNPQELLFADEHEAWQAGGIDLHLTVDQGKNLDWPLHVGVVTTLFDRLKSPTRDSYALLAGPDIMMRFSLVDLLKRGWRAENIFLSMERRMDCAIRMCGHCQVGPKYVCQDGPVFNYTEVEKIFGIVA